MAAPYRADHVGSLLRPPELLQARKDLQEGKITAEQLRELEDASIDRALQLQKDAGVDVFTDGEYRRAWWAGELAASIEGLIPDPTGGQPANANWQGPTAALANETLHDVSGGPVVAGEKIRSVRRIAGEEAAYLKQHAPGPWKSTLPGVGTRAYQWWKQGISNAHYPGVQDLVMELAAITNAEVHALIDDGCDYVQLDSLRYTTWMNPARAANLEANGMGSLEHQLDLQIAGDQASIAGARGKNPNVTVGHHICRGNNRSAWGGEGGYEPVAEKLFSTMNVDRFLLEYDTERAGNFEPLRFVPRDKMVVLGLISSKLGQLENEDDVIRRIEEASKYVPIENLALSPQCGFASTSPGNMLTWDEQKAKLELIARVARRVWG
jgi:5-methyltetrahydropteroyltriglutamate--homocysteine methyltransferase